ncbi:MAG TPA: hypothetical protein VKQ07_11025, partial [Jatrophihabitantaceae bacterium]|nr:hypothetical protein [Jatrophihabitantaceae bacterium]
MTDSHPTSDEIREFLDELDIRRNRLLELARAESSDTAADLIAAIDDIGAQLMVADEELRVQNEQLTRSARQLDLLVAAHEELFANAPTAYVQSDSDGLVVRMNRAARELLGI